MSLPFDGAISDFYRKKAPKDVRKVIENAGKHDILSETFPYPRELDKDDYKQRIATLQIELAKLQAHIKASGKRIVVVFEGRDAAGKGGAIRTLTENLTPGWPASWRCKNPRTGRRPSGISSAMSNSFRRRAKS